MTPDTYYEKIMPAAFSFLPDRMVSTPAYAMLLAIGMQESDFIYRKQQGGPARGFFQFEISGVKGVLKHHATGELAREIAAIFGYNYANTIHSAVEDNDLLSVIFARLYIYQFPAALPGKRDVEEGWRQYRATWRPGKPREERWEERYKRAWRIVSGMTLARRKV